MKRDENGIAVPSESSPLPWVARTHEGSPAIVSPSRAMNVAKFWDNNDAAYARHAANFHHRLADLVRRLVDWRSDVADESLDDIGSLAVELWYEIRMDGEQ